MSNRSIHAVTGAFGYSGKYIAQKLLALDHAVITLTNSTHRTNDFAGQVTAFPSLEYFRGKARLEKALYESGLAHAILRPAVLFGKEDILINNMAWTLRHLPIFGVFGDGQYKVQPIYVEDLADLAVHYGAIRDNVTIDAIGPETFTYRELVEVISHTIKSTATDPLNPSMVGLSGIPDYWCVRWRYPDHAG
jgi:uncharacterized protein YbjT (DUF2867 family)